MPYKPLIIKDDKGRLKRNFNMSKLWKVFQSRTFWTIVVMFVVNGITGIRDLIPVAYLPFIDGALGLLAIYFRANPRVNL